MNQKLIYRLLLALIFVGSACSNAGDSTAPISSIVPSSESLLPDYSNVLSWAASGNDLGASAEVPGGARASGGEKQVDVFYVHPTTLRSDTEWNQRIDDQATNTWTDLSVIRRQASVFNNCCRIFAPRYRAASFLATADRLLEGRGAEAYDFAYRDVLKAFDHFIEYENEGRPFVLAGHSQGAMMVSRLLKDRVDAKPLQDQLVAAYVIGYNVSVGLFGRYYQTLSACENKLQVGCVLSWNAVDESADLSQLKEFGGARYVADYGAEQGSELLCINPLTFDTSITNADSSLSKGAVPGAPDDSIFRALQATKVSASCQQGFLVVAADAALELTPLRGGSLHYHEFGLFYEDIRQNISARIAVYMSK